MNDYSIPTAYKMIYGEIYLSIASNRFTIGNILDMISNHDKFYLGNKDITNVIASFAMYAYSKDKNDMGEFIIREYVNEIEINKVIMQLIINKIDPESLFYIFGFLDYTDKTSTSAMHIFDALIKLNNSEYLEVLLDDKKFIPTITTDELDAYFAIKNIFGLRDRFRESYISNLILLCYNEKFEQKFSPVLFKRADAELIGRFYPTAKDVFLF